MIKTNPDKSCGLLDLHHLLGKKWTYGLLFNIDSKLISFTEIQKIADPKINPTLLSNRLKELVSFGILSRSQDDTRVFYSITEKGNDLKKVLFKLKLVAENLNCAVPHCCIKTDCSGCPSFRR